MNDQSSVSTQERGYLQKPDKSALLITHIDNFYIQLFHAFESIRDTNHMRNPL